MTAVLNPEGHLILPPEITAAARQQEQREYDVMISTSGVIMLRPERKPARSLVDSFAALRGLTIDRGRDSLEPFSKSSPIEPQRGGTSQPGAAPQEAAPQKPARAPKGRDNCHGERVVSPLQGSTGMGGMSFPGALPQAGMSRPVGA
jgi:hypothetical protein